MQQASTDGIMNLGIGGEDEMKRLVALLTVATLMVALLLPAVAASAQEQTVTVEVGPTAKLIEDGQAVQVKVKVSCEPPAEVLEAAVFAQQDEQTVWGEAGIASVVCDGNSQVRFVKVNALEGQFHRGEVYVSAFVLVCLEPNCADTAGGGDIRTTVKVVGGPR
jgi:hypothetical protein